MAHHVCVGKGLRPERLTPPERRGGGMTATALSSVQVSPTDLAGFLRTGACPSYLALRLRKQWCAELCETYNVERGRLDPVLARGGLAFEEGVREALLAAGFDVRDTSALKPFQVIELLRELQEPCVLWQVAVEGQLGESLAYGIADLVFVQPEDAGLRLRVVDIKASQHEKVEHRLQVAFYARMLAQSLADLAPRLEGAVLCREQPDAEKLTPFDLSLYDLGLEVLARVYVPRALEESEPFFNLAPRCAGCEFSALCLQRAVAGPVVAGQIGAGHPALVGELRDLELKALQAAGVGTLLEMASLLETESGELRPCGPVAERLLAGWPLGERLPRLVLQAQAVARRLKLRSAAPEADLPRTSASSLPGGPADLVRIMVDAQQDYREGRVYLLAARLDRSGELRQVCCLSEAPPRSDAAEEQLLRGFLEQLHAALGELAQGRRRLPLHLYLCDRAVRRVLSDALRRHLPQVDGAVFLYDWLTCISRADEPNVSLLMEEVREQRNLGWPMETLYTVSAGLRFLWGSLRTTFRAGCFDTAAWRVEASGNKRLVPAAWRSDSGIPLAYAYGAWGELPEQAGLEAFAVSRAQLLELSRQRLEALVFLVDQQLHPNRDLVKSPTPLPSYGGGRLATRTEALREFLRLEFGARKVKLLERFRRTPADRVAEGYCALGRCTQVDGKSFRLELAQLAGHNLLRFKEGDLVLLNPANSQHDQQLAVHKGAIVRLEQVSLQAVEGLLLGFGKRATAFRFGHVDVQPVVDALFSLDELVDDLLADKQQEACVRSRGSLLQRALEDDPSRFDLPVRPEQLQRAQRLLQGVPSLTARQREGVLLLLRSRLSLLQGPPGTGKSFSLGLAALAYHCAMGFSTRLLISGVTHTSVDIALSSIARRREELLAWPELPPELRQRLEELRLVRLVSAHKPGPPGVECINPYDERDRVRELFRGAACVVAGTPSAVHNLAAACGWPVRWDRELFHAAILDESSQMTVPAALLATAFLYRREGRLLLVGDHRQMAPIFMHEWARDQRRSTLDFRLASSVFETLLDSGFRRVVLDQSFRLHRVLASFIDRAIYRADTRLSSQRTEVLAPLAEGSDALARAALLPDFPLVLIEHEEGMSQHLNLLEVELAARILQCCLGPLGLCAADGVGVVVPHRAQRAALQRRFPDFKQVSAVDTVERYQGGERDVIILSATASEPHALEAEASFLFSRNRLNVAMSRPRKKLVVIASQNLFHFLSDDIELFESAALWKLLRYRYARQELFSGEVDGHRVRVLGCDTCQAVD